jgi:hypothetical protein
MHKTTRNLTYHIEKSLHNLLGKTFLLKFLLELVRYRMYCIGQFCGSGSEICCFFDLWIRDPEWKNSGTLDPGSAINIPDHISMSLITIICVKNAQILC